MTVFAIVDLPIPEIANETVLISTAKDNLEFVTKADILEEMIEYDIVVQMPPKRKYTINLEVKSISKAEPRVVRGYHWNSFRICYGIN